MSTLRCRIFGHKDVVVRSKFRFRNGTRYILGWYCLRCHRVHRIYQ